MEFKKETLIRGSIIFIGIFLILYSIINIILSLLPIVNDFMSGSLIGFKTPELKGYFIVLIIGFIIYIIGRQWKNLLKFLTGFIVSFAVLYITLVIFFIALSNNSTHVTESIQPSIDYLLASSIDDILDNYLESVDENSHIKVILMENISNEIIYNKNITLSQINLFSDFEKIFFKKNSILNQDQKKKFAKIVITQIYNNLNTSTKNISIPISQINQIMTDNMNMSLILTQNLSSLGLSSEEESILKNSDPEVIENLFKENPDLILNSLHINNEAKLNILLFNNSITKNIYFNNLNKKEVNLIWENLGLSSRISYKSKETLVKVIIPLISSQLPQTMAIENIAIPLASVSSMIPNEIKELSKYDFLNNNISKRANILPKLRYNCENKEIKIHQVCDTILIFRYNNLMSQLKNISNNNTYKIPINLTSSLENFDTLEKVNNSLIDLSSRWIKDLVISISLFLISLIVYYYHFKLNHEKLILIHIPYYITKLNLINFGIGFIFIVIFYFGFNYLLKFLSSLNIIGLNSKILLELPIILVLQDIFKDVFFFSVYYLIISILLFLSFYFILKTQVKKFESQTESFN